MKREELPRHATDSRTSGRLPRELDPVSLPSFRRALCSARMCSEILPVEPRPHIAPQPWHKPQATDPDTAWCLFRIAAVGDAHQPGAVAASNDLTNFPRHENTPTATRHTGGMAHAVLLRSHRRKPFIRLRWRCYRDRDLYEVVLVEPRCCLPSEVTQTSGPFSAPLSRTAPMRI